MSPRTVIVTALVALLTLLAAPRVPGMPDPEPLHRLPRPVASFGCAKAAGWLYVYGGHVGRAHKHSRDNLSGEFWRWNLLDRASWERLPGEAALQGLALVGHDGDVYRLGGMSARNASGAPEDLWSVADVARYDTRTRRWVALPPLPEARSSFDACVGGDTIYVAGGWRLAGEKRTWLASAYALDLSRTPLRWEALPPSPFQRRAVDLTFAAGRVYVLGGITPEGELSHAVDFFDVEEGEWRSAPDLPCSGFGISADAAGEAIVASTLDGRVHRLRPGASRWETVDRLHLGRFFHRAVTVAPGELLLVGGASRGGHSNWIESLDLHRDPSVPRLSRARIPYDGASRNRQGVLLGGEALTFFGGNNSVGQHDFAPENFVRESFRLRLPSLRIEEGPPFPRARQSMVALSAGDTAYALGGFGPDGGLARAHAEVFRLEQGEWRPAGIQLPQPRTQFSAVEHGGDIWVFGGLDYHPEREAPFAHPRAVLKWDGSSAGFEEVDALLPIPRRAFGGALLGSRYYLVGGMREEFQPVARAQAFSFETREWIDVPAPRRPRISPELAGFDGKLFLVGGSSPVEEGGFRPNRSLEMYDPESHEWRTLLEALPMETRHIRLFALEHCLLLVSTHGDPSGGIELLFLDPGRELEAASRPVAY